MSSNTTVVMNARFCSTFFQGDEASNRHFTIQFQDLPSFTIDGDIDFEIGEPDVQNPAVEAEVPFDEVFLHRLSFIIECCCLIILTGPLVSLSILELIKSLLIFFDFRQH